MSNEQARLAFGEILHDLVLADAIHYRFGDDEHLLWSRTHLEIERRGDALKYVKFSLACYSFLEIDCFKALIRCLKSLDRI